jgi:hypothetical protein
MRYFTGSKTLYFFYMENVRHMCFHIQKIIKKCVLTLCYFLLTYLCGTTTNIWLRPVQEDLSMTACLDHSASNI